MKKYIEPALHVLFWIGTYILFKSFLYQNITETSEVINDKVVKHVIARTPNEFILPGMFFKAAFCYAFIFIFYPIVNKKQSIGVLAGAILATAFLMFWVELLFQSLIFSFSFAERDQMFAKTVIRTNLLLYFFYSTVLLVYLLIKEKSILQHLSYRSKEEKYRTDIRFLKTQINPHFLFNTLNNLYSVAQKNNDEETADGISKLSGMMRFMLYETNTDKIPLSNELEYISNFIELQKLRYDKDELSLTFGQSVGDGSVQIAPLILIPFIENAFKHSYCPGHRSAIQIIVRHQGHELYFTVSNNVMEKNSNGIKESGLGLENVKARLRLLYPARHELKIENDNHLHTVVLRIVLS